VTHAVAVVDPPTPPVTLTGTHYQEVAASFLTQLEAIAASVPKLEREHALTKEFVRRHLNVPMAFLESAVAAVQLTPELQILGKLNYFNAHDTLQFLVAFRPVLDKLEAFYNDLKFTMNSKKAGLTDDALQIYHITKGLARDAASTEVYSHMQNMKRDFPKRPRRKKADPEAAAKEEVTTTLPIAA
jgi:hypothetical protein